MIEYCQNIKPFRQPIPSVNDSGDCFACAVAAVFNNMFPKENITLKQALEWFEGKDSSNNTVFHNNWWGYEKAFEKSGMDVEFKKFLPLPDYEHFFEYRSMSWYPMPDAETWQSVVEGFLRCGWHILTEIDSNGNGSHLIEGGKIVKNNTNHAIVIDGVREYWPEWKDGEKGKAYQYDVHVVDSSKKHKTNEYWISTWDLINNHGAAGLWLVRQERFSRND